MSLLAQALAGERPAGVPILWLGAQEPWWCWDDSTTLPLLVSAARILERQATPRGARVPKGFARPATCPVFLDSGAFSWLSNHGTWATWPADEFAAFIAATCRVLGTVEHVGVQDWMCEASILALTGLTLEEHQRRTVASYLELRALAPEVPWLVTLQGHEPADYLRCASMLEDMGVRLSEQQLVGVGSVCRRDSVDEISAVFDALTDALPGVRLHGYGVKGDAAVLACSRLWSVDSAAWSRRGRYAEQDIRKAVGLPIGAPWSAVRAAGLPTAPGLAELAAFREQHAPGGLQNCQAFAERWRLRQLDALCQQADRPGILARAAASR